MAIAIGSGTLQHRTNPHARARGINMRLVGHADRPAMESITIAQLEMTPAFWEQFESEHGGQYELETTFGNTYHCRINWGRWRTVRDEPLFFQNVLGFIHEWLLVSESEGYRVRNRDQAAPVTLRFEPPVAPPPPLSPRRDIVRKPKPSTGANS